MAQLKKNSPRNNDGPVIMRNTVTQEPNKKQKNELSEMTYDQRFAFNFCSCCEDCKLCCCGFFCLPCLVCTLYRDTKEGDCSGCWQCFTFYWPYNCCWSNLSHIRTKIRGTFKLHGSLMEDIFYSSVCPCCAAIQMKLELESQGLIN